MSDIVGPQPQQKSWVQAWVDKAKGDMAKAPAASPVSYVRETGSIAGEYAEGGALSAVLGAAHAKFGLDTKGGPIDGWFAGIGAIGAIGLSGHYPQLAAHLRKLGSTAFTVLAFRKGYEAVKHTPLPGGTSSGAVQRIAAPSGSQGGALAGEDPIEKVAKGLG